MRASGTTSLISRTVRVNGPVLARTARRAGPARGLALTGSAITTTFASTAAAAGATAARRPGLRELNGTGDRRRQPGHGGRVASVGQPLGLPSGASRARTGLPARGALTRCALQRRQVGQDRAHELGDD